MGAKKFLTKALLEALVVSADAAGNQELAIQSLMAWHFLLRVQSECTPLEVGQPQDATQLACNRHSAVWVDGVANACLRLRLRKTGRKGPS